MSISTGYMTVRQYVLVMVLSALLCWVAWFFVLFSMDPSTGVFPAVLLFYLTLFCAIAATFSVVGLLLRRKRRPQDALGQHVVVSFRQGVFFGLLVAGALTLQRERLFTWPRFFLLGLLVSFLEFLVLAFSSHRRHRKRVLRSFS